MMEIRPWQTMVHPLRGVAVRSLASRALPRHSRGKGADHSPRKRDRGPGLRQRLPQPCPPMSRPSSVHLPRAPYGHPTLNLNVVGRQTGLTLPSPIEPACQTNHHKVHGQGILLREVGVVARPSLRHPSISPLDIRNLFMALRARTRRHFLSSNLRPSPSLKSSLSPR